MFPYFPPFLVINIKSLFFLFVFEQINQYTTSNKIYIVCKLNHSPRPPSCSIITSIASPSSISSYINKTYIRRLVSLCNFCSYLLGGISGLNTFTIIKETHRIRRFALTFAVGIHELLERSALLNLEEHFIPILFVLELSIHKPCSLLSLLTSPTTLMLMCSVDGAPSFFSILVSALSIVCSYSDA